MAKSGQKKVGAGPQKLCECGVSSHARVRVCPSCGKVFPMKEKTVKTVKASGEDTELLTYRFIVRVAGGVKKGLELVSKYEQDAIGDYIASVGGKTKAIELLTAEMDKAK